MNAQVQESDIAVQAKTQRILGFDLLRGFFLIAILIDHIELFPNILDYFTGQGRLFVSAAEGFFFLSGLLIGIVYKRRLAKGMKFIFKKLWRRSFQLYLASIFFTLFYVALAVYTHHTNIKDGLPDPMNWHFIIKETLLLRFAYGWSDFLVRFAILMAIAPFVFWLVAKGKWRLMLAISIVVWFFRGDNFTLSWQIIFNSGIALGFYWQEIRHWLKSLKPKPKRYLKRATYGAALITFTVSYLSFYLRSLLSDNSTGLTPWLQHVAYTWNNYDYDVWVYAQKWNMGPLRIVLFFLWFAALFMLIEKYQNQINSRTKGILELLGRNSLFVYVVESFIIFGIKFFAPVQTTFLKNSLITAAGIVLMIIVTMVYKAFTGGSGFSWADKWAESVKINRLRAG